MKKKKSKIIPLHDPGIKEQIINKITARNLEKLSQDLGEITEMLDGHYKKEDQGTKEEE